MAKKKEIGIEEGLLKLEEILGKMEESDTELTEAFDLYAEGMKLLKSVNEQIDDVEKKVKMISGDSEVEFESEED